MSMSGMQILHVDDDDVEREAVARGLRRSDLPATLHTASDGVEALDILRRNGALGPDAKPYLVLLDWKMPRMNGAEFLAELRDDPELRNTVVFVLSTSNDQTDIDQAYEQLAAAYIVKDRAGSNFTRLTDLLMAYCDVVELPA